MRAWVKLPNLAPHPVVRSTIGDDWLRNRVAVASDAMGRRTDLSPSAQGMSVGKLDHPLVAELWEMESANGPQALESPLLDLLETDLSTLGDLLPSNARLRLRNDAECSKIMYELHIGAAILRLGHTMSWPPDEGQRRPELIVNQGLASAFSVECKKRDPRDGYEKAADQFFSHFQHAMLRRMKELDLNYWLRVTGRDFRLGDVDRVVKEASEAMNTTDGGTVQVVNARYTVDYLKLAEQGGRIPGELIRAFPAGDLGVNSARGLPTQLVAGGPHQPFAVGLVSDPRLLRIQLADDRTHKVRGILRNLKTASKQILMDQPSVIYIETNFRDFDSEFNEFVQLVDAVRSEMKRAYTRLSAVVLTAMYPGRSRDGVLGWRIRSEFIPQQRAINRLPVELHLPGSPEMLEWFPGDWRHGA